MPATQTAGLAHHLPDRSLPLIEGSVGDVLRRIAAQFPAHNALGWADGDGAAALTYPELLAEAEQIARFLLQFGVPGDRVAIWSRNSLEWILLEHGCALAGMVIASWIPAWTDTECTHARDLTTPVLLFAGHDTRGVTLLDRARQLVAPDRVFDLADIRSLAKNAPDRALPKISADAPFLIQFTSGTTGRAKGATLSNRAALNSAWLRFTAIGANETDVCVNPSPMSHMGGAVTMVLGNLVTAGCYVVMNKFEAGEMLRLMQLFGATRTGGVPTMLLALAEHPGWIPGAFSLRSIGAGGAQVPQALTTRLMREFGSPVLVSYAQSECPMIANTGFGDSPDILATTVGTPSPHIEMKICAVQGGHTLGYGEIGEICVRGPIIMDGYYRMPEATAAAIDADGFLHTGDLGSLDAQGYVRINGRSRDVIIRGGENIYPAEVEDALLTHPGVQAIAVVGVADDRWGQQVAAAVQPAPGAVLDAAALEAHAGAHLAHFKLPRNWLFVESFPLTASGKIRKVEVEAWFKTEEKIT